MMNDSEKSKLYLIGLKYLEKNEKLKFKNEFDFIKTIYLESINFDIGNNIYELKEYFKCKINEMDIGDIAIYKSDKKSLIGINYGSALEKGFMYYDEEKQKVKMAELHDNIEEYKFQYGIKLNHRNVQTMNHSLQFNQYRKEYEEFYFNSYTIKDDNEAIYLEYEFEIPKLTKFNPKLKILKKDFVFKNINTPYVQNMVFHIGLIELISYWKSTCSPKIIIKCGYLNEEQIEWWKKLYFYGLGELFYTNNIKIDIINFTNIECTNDISMFDYEKISDTSNGYIVPIGGGKDSVVTLETLKVNRNDDYCLIINPKPVTLKCAEIAGFKSNNIIEIYRTIDKNLINLNEKGFINGHTPFSAMLAFLSYFVAYLLSKKYIAVSNENSANESNIIGEKINHQYSKSFEFECDFEKYASKYLRAPIKYFSFLRPLNELQIAKIFSKKEKYHNIFKSCNIGSKEKEWKWCCNCAKCLFTYTILSPYLYKEKLVRIFGEDLFEKSNLLNTFLELTGNGETKPFDCVGTFEEVNFAISKTIENIEKAKMDLPYLLRYYKDNYKLIDTKNDLTKIYNQENNLNKEQNDILRKEVFSSD